MAQVFERYRPEVVFHAAAYKHVPLMEANPLESVRNNVLGTRTVAEVSIAHGVERFVLVSTDKALNPHSIYGQSKTLCEWIVGAHGDRADVPTRFVAVRFGNVLNSAGSVIPLFRRQIERGGPLTVTDPEMTRFFMTIPEAVALVIQAGAIGGRGRILVLDMGEPIRILDLARNMIRLSGKEPDRDIEITFIGARPGEKLHEELFAEGETWKPTSHPKIVVLDVSPVDRTWLDERLDELEALVEAGDTLELVGRLAAIAREPQRVELEADAPDAVDPPPNPSYSLRVRGSSAAGAGRPRAGSVRVPRRSSSTTSVPAWTSTRNQSSPKPPRRRRCRSTPSAPSGDSGRCDWSTRAMTSWVLSEMS